MVPLTGQISERLNLLPCLAAVHPPPGAAAKVVWAYRMATTCFRIVIDLDMQALLRVLQTFARPGLRPAWMVVNENEGALHISAHFGAVPADVTENLLMRLGETPGVHRASTTNLNVTIG